MIEVIGVTKKFADKVVLDNISLSVENNQALCIIGSVGCGKSTLLRCIAGLEQPTEGEILINGSPLKVSQKNGYNGIGVVLQSFNLFPHLTIMQNMVLAPVCVKKMSRADAEAAALRQLEMVGLVSKKDLYPHQLSAGQRQRVAIARCLVMNPEVILFDEPTSALDPISISEVKEVMRKLKKEVSIVVVTHDLDLVSEIADEVIYMNQGVICEKGNPVTLLNTPFNEETKRFISHNRNLLYDITSSFFDHPELNARIEHYCFKIGLGKKAVHYVQLVVEELLNILPLYAGCNITISKAPSDFSLNIDILFPDEGVDYLNPESGNDELSLSIIFGLCSEVNQSLTEEGKRLLHAELSQDKLLM